MALRRVPEEPVKTSDVIVLDAYIKTRRSRAGKPFDVVCLDTNRGQFTGYASRINDALLVRGDRVVVGYRESGPYRNIEYVVPFEYPEDAPAGKAPAPGDDLPF